MIVIAVLSVSQALVASGFDEVRGSHVDGNVPSPAEFTALLRRDLDAYFNAAHEKRITVQHELLRDGPTQSGTSYPKFYLWVRLLQEGVVVEEGAVRVAAIDRSRFEITSFTSESDLRADPRALHSIFPAAVCETIRAKLGIER